MSIKSNNIVINPEYESLFSFENEAERTEHNAQMISYKVLSEIEKVCNEKNINKQKLAAMVGTSKSYITQLFRGTKSINTHIMEKFEDALNISFEIKVKLNEESYSDFLGKQLSLDILSSVDLNDLIAKKES
ncbi:Helix-turn-helix [Chitinophaga sp. CF118]|uniref:helix-turn-helix domain-containing protein n=1 Tax=Chitinophaga sp. CF118 TaxID=1884367 RepID=UPI0008EEF8D0|nr:helix-turn-helix transcriptional regulator [Chitinophaga sp. CF118]SFE97815.1 Helix-turn-helix [Chitinophaga sp. CF118]